MEWNRTETIALARNSCKSCHGEGLHPGRGSNMSPCNCVLRGVFRACYARFRECVTKEKYMSKITLERFSNRGGRVAYGRKDEEFIADFYLVSKRNLDEFDFKVFRYHFLLGADWRLCCRQMKIDRGTFFHSVYRIQQKLGRVFRELEPYSLFPLDEYFGGRVYRSLPKPSNKVLEMPLRFPLRAPLVQPSIEKVA